jgi:hypothetical protein
MSNTPRTDAIAHRGYHLDALAARSIDLCRELERENGALREKDEDWENAVLHARDHRCDEAHCTCVVPLLGKINQLERENAALRSALDYQASYQRDLRTDRDRLDWLLSKDGGWWAYWQLDYGPWTADKDELIRRIDAKLEKEAQP